jgi:hypothetical protein
MKVWWNGGIVLDIGSVNVFVKVLVKAINQQHNNKKLQHV